MVSRFVALTVVAVVTAVPAVASASTRLSLNRTDVGGTHGRERLRGYIDLATPSYWQARTPHGAPEAEMVYGLGKTCVVIVRAGGRAAASRETSRERAARFTRAPPHVLLGQGRAHAGWWRLARMRWLVEESGEPALSDNLYGFRAYRVARRRWVDVRLLVEYRGCTEGEVMDGSTHADVARVLRTATVQARVVRR